MKARKACKKVRVRKARKKMKKCTKTKAIKARRHIGT